MGLQCQILLDTEAKQYFPGESVTGRVIVMNDDSRFIKGLRIKFIGRCEVNFLQLKNKLVRNGPGNVLCQKRMVNTHDEEVYLQSVLNILENDEERLPLLPGRFEFPFKYDLPHGLPASFDGLHGKVSYKVQAELPLFWGPDCEAVTEFYVLGVMDLSMNGETHQEERTVTKRKLFSRFSCCPLADASFSLKLQRSVVCVGEYVPFILEVNNDTKNVMGTKISLIQKSVYRAKRKNRIVSTQVCSIEGPAVVPGDYDVWSGHILQVPNCVPSGLGGACSLIDVRYELKMEMFCRGNSSLEGEVPITICVRSTPRHAGHRQTNLSTGELPPSYEMAVVSGGTAEAADGISSCDGDCEPPAYIVPGFSSATSPFLHACTTGQHTF